MKIALATDHAGFDQLPVIMHWLQEQGHECYNFGPDKLQQSDDYTDYIFPAAKAVAGSEYERGIIFGGSGQGEAMAANKVKGIRCSLFYGPVSPSRVVDAEGRTSHNPYEIIKLSRQHNNSNMLSLAARFVSTEDMKLAIRLWLDTPFSQDERHARRNQKLDEAGC